MKVKVEVTLDVDPEVLCLEYGLMRSEVRDWVKDAVDNDVHGHYQNLGWLKPGKYDR